MSEQHASTGADARGRIEAAHRYGAIYRGGFASHHPMAIAALDAMGATDADLDRFEAHYLPQLEPIPRAVVEIRPGDDGLDWPGIHARAVKREDEHDIKLAYSCWREWQHRGDDLYRRAASARVS